MNGVLPIHQAFHFSPLQQLEQYKSHICANPLVQRVTANWKVILMDCSTIICITAFVITFLTGSTMVCSAFAIAAVASAVSAFYMRQFSTLSDLEDTAHGLRVTKEKFEGIAKDFERENNRLTESNRELQRNNETFRASNQNLIQTNARLSAQVAQLTLQVSQLRESAERIRFEVQRFQQQNQHLHINVGVLDQQILNSRALCEQISTQLANQQIGLGQQLEQLRQYLADLTADNRVHERIQQLATLQSQAQLATQQLHQIQLQYASELAKFQTIREALVQIRNQFDMTIRDAQSNNNQLRVNVDALAQERQRIQDLINRHAPTSVSPRV